MKVRVLGCSGGIGKGVATTSFLIDDDILIDAGTGVCNLTLSEMRQLRTIFISHSHLDHIAAVPLLVDTLFDSLIDRPLQVYAQRSTIKAMRDHIFNEIIWPDFTVLPRSDKAVLRLNSMAPGEVIEIDGRQIEMIAVNHAVPGAGYRVESNASAFAFSGDTTSNESFWASLNKHQALDLLFIETAFANKDIELARLAFHYCPELLAKDLPKLRHKPDVYISHLKSGEEERILKECQTALPEWGLRQLKNGDVFEL